MDEYDPDAFASVLDYDINIKTMNRIMSPVEREAVRAAVQSALNLLSVQMKFATMRNPVMVKVSCTRTSSTTGEIAMEAATEATHEGETTNP